MGFLCGPDSCQVGEGIAPVYRSATISMYAELPYQSPHSVDTLSLQMHRYRISHRVLREEENNGRAINI